MHRHRLALAILASATVSVAGAAAAQPYAPGYPVCLYVYDQGGNYYDCSYASLPQCNLSASGRGAQCVVNPYANAYQEPSARRHTQHRVY
jgi:hypothetical protein